MGLLTPEGAGAELAGTAPTVRDTLTIASAGCMRLWTVPLSG